MKKFLITGIMSGTSCDGLDIALCSFRKTNKNWNFEIIKAATFKYHKSWLTKLKNAPGLNAFEFIKLHNEYGSLIGEKTKKFLKENNLQTDFIASHGHTIFHKPEEGITFQLGNGAYIASASGINTISDFRTLDVALGGQGAPLVPIGDELLFGDYDYCLNLGGFANISYKSKNKRIAFDICPVNIAINYLTQKFLKKEYDKDGLIASKGKVNQDLLKKLNLIQFYNQKPPKSLGKEWLDKYFIPLLDKSDDLPENIIRTITEHIAFQISQNIPGKGKLLITGGGAYNLFLINLLKKQTKATIVIPDNNVIQFKEALIFAFLGLLNINNEKNCLTSVTGAKADNIGGILYKMYEYIKL